MLLALCQCALYWDCVSTFCTGIVLACCVLVLCQCGVLYWHCVGVVFCGIVSVWCSIQPTLSGVQPVHGPLQLLYDLSTVPHVYNLSMNPYSCYLIHLLFVTGVQPVHTPLWLSLHLSVVTGVPPVHTPSWLSLHLSVACNRCTTCPRTFTAVTSSVRCL